MVPCPCPCPRSSDNKLLLYLFIYLIYFWLCWVFVAARGLSLVAASGVYSLLQCAGFSLRWPLLLQSTGSRCTAFSSCSTWAQQLWHMDPVFVALGPSICGTRALEHTGFGSCGAWAQQLRCVGSRAHNLQQLWHVGFSSCDTWAQWLWLTGSRAQAQQLWRMGLVALWHVGSSRTRARTCVPVLAGGFLTTAPPGKSLNYYFKGGGKCASFSLLQQRIGEIWVSSIFLRSSYVNLNIYIKQFLCFAPLTLPFVSTPAGTTNS